MTTDAWLTRWQEGRTGFHRSAVHADLIEHIASLLPTPGRILVPLCGKSLDLGWLVAQGCEVVGVELSPLAAQQYHEAAGITPEIHQEGDFTVWRSPGLSYWVGDFFQLPPGRFDAVWDRAAMVALPPHLRDRYTACIKAQLGAGGRLLLNCLTYDLPRDQPPFSITDDEVRRHYGAAGTLTKLSDEDRLADEPRWLEAGMQMFRRRLWLLQTG